MRRTRSVVDEALWNVISRRKTRFPVSEPFARYLERFGRMSAIPDIYPDLCHFQEAFPCLDPHGNETLWQTVVYPAFEFESLKKKLTTIYADLKIGGDYSLAEHLKVERVDYGQFGNSRPFRIRIVNKFNDNYDHYYVKTADASRLYGLELDYILSPNRNTFLLQGNTLIEEHIAGIPGDIFIAKYFDQPDLNRVRIAKEFVKFNERCFTRLLGDMRSVNYVVDVTPDFEEVQYRVRPIDFDYQSYDGRRNMYLCQFFKDNYPVVQLVTELLNWQTIKQYQNEERTLIAKRRRLAHKRFHALIKCMREDLLSTPDRVEQLKEELGSHHATKAFKSCRSMGDIVHRHIEVMLEEADG